MDRSLRVLVVDDEPEFVEMLTYRLKDNGYEVQTASSGAECIERIQQELPDAILLDIHMPGASGLEVLQQIRKDYSKLPVFMLTADSDPTKFQQAKDSQASGFMVKMSNMQHEIERITKILRLSGNFKGKKDSSE